MNETPGGPPDRAAENWSRRDGIRAGSVSGPWRSGPREAAPAGAPPAAGRAASPPGPPPPGPATAAAGVERDAAPARPARHAMHAGAAHRGSGGLGLVVWVAFGLVLAAAIVGAAFLLRASLPDGALRSQAPPPADATAAGEAAGFAEAAATVGPEIIVEPAAVAAVAGPVRLRIGAEASPERRAAVETALADAGVAPVAVEMLPFPVETSRVGYFRADDLDAAETLAGLLAPATGSLRLSDYSMLMRDAEPGRLDLWIGD